MAWRQSPGGSEQHLTRAAAAARTRTQRPGKHLAVHASELVVKPDFQILRRYRRPLLLRLEHTHRPTLEDYVHRATRLGSSRSLNLRIGITPLVARQELTHGRDVRQRVRARRGGYCERTQAASPDILDGRRHCRKAHLYLPREEIGQSRPCSTIENVHHINTSHYFEK